jgi:hypothetical protein
MDRRSRAPGAEALLCDESLTVGRAEVFAVLADGDAVTGSAAGDSAHYFGVCASAARVRDRLRDGVGRRTLAPVACLASLCY